MQTRWWIGIFRFCRYISEIHQFITYLLQLSKLKPRVSFGINTLYILMRWIWLNREFFVYFFQLLTEWLWWNIILQCVVRWETHHGTHFYFQFQSVKCSLMKFNVNKQCAIPCFHIRLKCNNYYHISTSKWFDNILSFSN